MFITRIVLFDVKQILRHWFLYAALILSFLPAFGIAYSIKNLEGPFTLAHITSFYALFGTILSVVIAMMLYTKDISNGTITLMLNEKNHRSKYLFSKFISSAVVGFVFGCFCSLTISFVHFYLSIEVKSLLYVKAIFNYTLFTLLYTVIFFFVSTFYKNVAGLFVVAVLSISFLPNLVSTALSNMNVPGMVKTIIENTPIYFLPNLIGPHNIDGVQYGVIFAFIFVFFIASNSLIRSQDY